MNNISVIALQISCDEKPVTRHIGHVSVTSKLLKTLLCNRCNPCNLSLSLLIPVRSRMRLIENAGYRRTRLQIAGFVYMAAYTIAVIVLRLSMRTKHITQLAVTVTHDEAARIKARARDAGVNVSNLIRDRLALPPMKMGAKTGPRSRSDLRLTPALHWRHG